MNYKRLIPVLLLQNGLLVRSQLFRYHQCIGDPIPTIKRLGDWSVDEIILLNISPDKLLDSRRDDKWHNLGKTTFAELLVHVSKFCFAPLTVGGGLRNAEDIANIFRNGADKCTLNTLLFADPDLVKDSSSRYGAQAIVGSLDVSTGEDGQLYVFTESGRKPTDLTLDQAIDHACSLGIGELLISSIDRDGSGQGYDEKVIACLNRRDLRIPVIVNSGCNTISQFKDGLCSSCISAVAASNVFYFSELSYPTIKKKLLAEGMNVRSFELDKSYVRREPVYDVLRKESLMAKGFTSEHVDKSLYNGSSLKTPRYCRRCLYSSLSATPMQFDETGLCMGCVTSDAKLSLSKEDYQTRKVQLLNIVNEGRGKADYDCIVSVSGGKDSYYQTHYVIHELGLKPLLVTYNGNNYSDVGWKNLMRMREVFDCDHVIISPSINTLKKLNKIAFIVMGDMNWHAHVGIFTTAPRVAVQQKIPLIFWGEHGYADLCGQFGMQDFPEMNYRERTEHAGRGFDWPFFVGIDEIKEEDLNPWKYPADNELLEVGLRQIYLGHFIPWESNDHLQLVVERYGFEVSTEPFERTYRVGSNLDDIHENGVHDYLKYIKFGYGRCTDHASKDIRAGKLNRDCGIDLVKSMDHVKPKDLLRWLDYVDMCECEFDRISDYFRDPRVWKWSKESGWSKVDIDIVRHG